MFLLYILNVIVNEKKEKLPNYKFCQRNLLSVGSQFLSNVLTKKDALFKNEIYIDVTFVIAKL
jgi:hypothetical protein